GDGCVVLECVGCDPWKRVELWSMRNPGGNGFRNFRCAKNNAGLGVSDYGCQARERTSELQTVRRITRHGDHTCIDRAEERRDEIEAGRVEQHRTIARSGPSIQEGSSDRAGASIKLRISERGVFVFAVCKKGVGARVSLMQRAVTQDVNQRMEIVGHTPALMSLGCGGSMLRSAGSLPCARIES